MLNKLYRKLIKQWLGLSKKRQVFYFVISSILLLIIIAPSLVKAGVGGTIASLLGWIISAIIEVFSSLITVELNIFAKFAQFNNFLGVTAVKEGWKLVRDLCNMFFILILLVISFATILKMESYAYKKWLGKLVMAAILINFSKTITGFLIGFSQVVMLTFVSAFKDAVAGNLAQGMHLSEMMSASGSSEWDQTVNPDGKSGEDLLDSATIFGTLALALALLTVFVIVMLIMIVVLVGRIVTLWVLIILSPLAYLLQASPFGQKYAKQWWQELGKNLVSGPVLAFFLWLAFLTIQRSGEKGVAQMRGTLKEDDFSLGAVVNEEPVFLSGISKTTYLMDYIVTIALLLAAIKLTQEMGVVGSSFAGQMQQNLGKWGKKAVVGTLAGTTRGTRLAMDRGISKTMLGQFIPGTTAYKMRKAKKEEKVKSYIGKTVGMVDKEAKDIYLGKDSSSFKKHMYSTLAESASANADDGFGPLALLKKVNRVRSYKNYSNDSDDNNQSIHENEEAKKFAISIKIEKEDLADSKGNFIKNIDSDIKKREEELKDIDENTSPNKYNEKQNEIEELKKQKVYAKNIGKSKIEDVKNFESGLINFEKSSSELKKLKNEKVELEKKNKPTKNVDKLIENKEKEVKKNSVFKNIESGIRNEKMSKYLKYEQEVKIKDLDSKRDDGEISTYDYKKEKKRIKSNFLEMEKSIYNGDDPSKGIENALKNNIEIKDKLDLKISKNSPFFRVDNLRALIGGDEQYKAAKERYEKFEGESGDDQSKLLKAAIENKKNVDIDVILEMMAKEGNLSSAISIFNDENGESLTDDAKGLGTFMKMLGKKTGISEEALGYIYNRTGNASIKGQDYQYGRSTARNFDGRIKILDEEAQIKAMSSYVNYVKQGRSFAQDIKKGFIVNNRGEVNQVGLESLKKSSKALKSYTKDMNADVLEAIYDKSTELFKEGVDGEFLKNVKELVEKNKSSEGDKGDKPSENKIITNRFSRISRKRSGIKKR